MAAQSEIGAAGSLVTETAPQTVVATQPNGIQGPQGSGSSRTGVDVALPSSAHPGGPAASQPLQPTTNASNSISGTTEKVLGADSASRAAGSGSPHTEGEGNSPQDSKPDDSAPHSSLLDNSKVVGDSQGSQGTQAGAQGPQGGQTQVPVVPTASAVPAGGAPATSGLRPINTGLRGLPAEIQGLSPTAKEFKPQFPAAPAPLPAAVPAEPAPAPAPPAALDPAPAAMDPATLMEADHYDVLKSTLTTAAVAPLTAQPLQGRPFPAVQQHAANMDGGVGVRVAPSAPAAALFHPAQQALANAGAAGVQPGLLSGLAQVSVGAVSSPQSQAAASGSLQYARQQASPNAPRSPFQQYPEGNKIVHHHAAHQAAPSSPTTRNSPGANVNPNPILGGAGQPLYGGLRAAAASQPTAIGFAQLLSPQQAGGARAPGGGHTQQPSPAQLVAQQQALAAQMAANTLQVQQGGVGGGQGMRGQPRNMGPQARRELGFGGMGHGSPGMPGVGAMGGVGGMGGMGMGHAVPDMGLGGGDYSAAQVHAHIGMGLGLAGPSEAGAFAGIVLNAAAAQPVAPDALVAAMHAITGMQEAAARVQLLRQQGYLALADLCDRALLLEVQLQLRAHLVAASAAAAATGGPAHQARGAPGALPSQQHMHQPHFMQKRG